MPQSELPKLYMDIDELLRLIAAADQLYNTLSRAHPTRRIEQLLMQYERARAEAVTIDVNSVVGMLGGQLGQ